ncbi:MAG: hypothetical protein ABIB65_02805 [Candidatus Margulisiibacteriota bacterium]
MKGSVITILLCLVLTTASYAASINGLVLNNPNPFNPAVEITEIGYDLSEGATVDLYIFNLYGQRIFKKTYPEGSVGGSAGYNKVSWDGISDFGYLVPNDIYLCRLVSRGKVIGKCKIAVLR